MNYQYRNGTSFPVALKTLYADGGIPRFYRGVLPALIQGPLSRFGDTAANTGMLTLMNSFDATKDLNVGYKTVAASGAAAAFRIFLMPVVSCECLLYLSFAFFWITLCTTDSLANTTKCQHSTGYGKDYNASNRKVLERSQQSQNRRNSSPLSRITRRSLRHFRGTLPLVLYLQLPLRKDSKTG